MAETVRIELEAADKNVATVFADISSQVASLTTKILAIGGASAGFLGLVSAGLKFNEMMELGRLGIEATLTTFKNFQDEQGKTLTGIYAFSAAIGVAADAQAKLQMASFQTTASMKELSTGFERIIAASGSQKATIDQQVQLTVGAANMAKLLGISYEQAFRQISLVMMGVARTQGQMGAFLRTLGIDPATAKSWQQQGTSVQNLIDKLEVFMKIGPQLQQTFAGEVSQIQKVASMFAGIGTKDLFEPVMVDTMQKFVSLFVDFSEKIPKLKEDAVNLTKVIGAGLAGAFTILVDTATGVFKIIDDVVKDSGLTWLQIFKLTATVAIEAFGVVERAVLALATAIMHPFDTIKGLLAIFFSGVVLGLSDMLRSLGDSITALTTGPTANFLSKIIPGFAGLQDAAKLAGEGIGILADKVQNVGIKLSNTDSAKKFADSMTEIDSKVSDQVDRLVASVWSIGMGFDAVGDKVAGMTPKFQGFTDAQKKVIASFDEWITKQTIALEPAGLDGYAGKLAVIHKWYVDANLELNKHVEALVKAGVYTDALKQRVANYNIAIATAFDAKKLLLMTDATFKYEKAMEEMASKVHTSVQQQIQDQGDATDQFIRNKEKEAVAEGITDDRKLAAHLRASALMLENDEETARKIALSTAGRDQNWNAIIEDANKKAMEGVMTISEALGHIGAEMEKWGTTAADGINAGLMQVFAKIPNEAQMAANAVKDVWGNMTKAFDDLFYDVLSGKMNNLKDVFKSFGDSILHTMAKTFSDMVQNWIKSLLQMGDASKDAGSGKGIFSAFSGLFGGGATTAADRVRQESAPEFVGPPSSAAGGGGGLSLGGGGDASGLAGVLGTAAQGYAVGSALGNIGNGKYNMAGAQIGAVAGAIVGTYVFPGIGTAIGTIIGAIVGLIVGAIASPNTEQHVRAEIGNMLTSSMAGRQILPQTGLEQQGQAVIGSMTSDLFSIFQMADKDHAAQFTSAYHQAVVTALQGAHVDIAAGSKDDIDKDVKQFLTGILPKLALQAGFGQVGFQPPGNRDAPGGIGGFDWWAPGMDQQGKWLKTQLYDPNAPIPAMLKGLGFTADKIAEIATRLATDDPQKFIDYLKGIVGVVVQWNDLSTALSQNTAQVFAAMDVEANKSPADLFRTNAQDLAQQVTNLNLFSGDEQIKQAQAVLKAISDRYTAELQYIGKIRDAMTALDTQAQTIRGAIADYLLPPDLAARNRQTLQDIMFRPYEVGGGEGQNAFDKATTPEQVQALAQKGFAAIQALFSGLAQQIQQAQAVIDTVTSNVASQREAMRTAMMTPQQLMDDAAGNLASVMSTLGKISVNDPAKLQEIAQKGIEAIKVLFDGLTAQVREGTDTLNSVTELSGLFRSMRSDSGADAARKADPFSAFASDTADLQRQLAAAAQLSGMAQIDAIKSVQAAAKTMYDSQKALLQQITSQAQELHTSIAAQRRDMQLAQMDPTQQANFLHDEIDRLGLELEHVTDPARVKEITSQQQADIGQYLGLFQQGDPNKSAAFAWADKVLQETERVGELAYSTMTDKLTAANDKVAGILDATGTMLKNNITDATTQIGLLDAALLAIQNSVTSILAPTIDGFRAQIELLGIDVGRLQEMIDNRMKGLVDEIIATNGPILDALRNSLKLFTDAIDATTNHLQPTGSGGGGGGGGAGGGLVPGDGSGGPQEPIPYDPGRLPANNPITAGGGAAALAARDMADAHVAAAGAVWALHDAANALATKLGGTSSQTSAPSGAGNGFQAALVNRDNPGLLTRRFTGSGITA